MNRICLEARSRSWTFFTSDSATLVISEKIAAILFCSCVNHIELNEKVKQDLVQMIDDRRKS